VEVEILDIFGKKYQIQSGLTSEEIERINRDIIRRMKTLAMEYPALDRIDTLILYIIELNEKIVGMEKKTKKEKENLERIRSKIDFLETKIKEEIKNLDKRNTVL